MLCSRSGTTEQITQSIAYGGAYFELLWSLGMNVPGLFSFEGNLVHVLGECSMTESKVQSRGDNQDIPFRSTNVNVNVDLPTKFAVNEKERSVIHT